MCIFVCIFYFDEKFFKTENIPLSIKKNSGKKIKKRNKQHI